MEYGKIDGLDKPVSRLVQGTMMIDTERLDESLTLLDGIWAAGGNAFDLAHTYCDGRSERAFGQWLKTRGNRQEIVIITKGAHHNLDRRRVTPFDITADLFDSLTRLQVETIDVYLLHRDDPSVPVEPIVDILNEHQQAGRIRAFGGSNWTHERIQAANHYAVREGLSSFVVSSPNLSLAEQVEEPWAECVSIGGKKGRAAREWYQQFGLAVLSWSSLASGFFSGRYTRENYPLLEDNFWNRILVRCYCYEENFQRLDRVMALAKEQGVSAPEIALAYIFSLPLNVFALVGCHSTEEFIQNKKATTLRLTDSEIQWLESGESSS